MDLSTERTYHRWIKYLFLAFVSPLCTILSVSSGTLSCEKSHRNTDSYLVTKRDCYGFMELNV